MRFASTARSMSPWGEKYYGHTNCDFIPQGRGALMGVSQRPMYNPFTTAIGPGEYDVCKTKLPILGIFPITDRSKASLSWDNGVPGPGYYPIKSTMEDSKKCTIHFPWPDGTKKANEVTELPASSRSKMARTVRSTFGESPRTFGF